MQGKQGESNDTPDTNIVVIAMVIHIDTWYLMKK